MLLFEIHYVRGTSARNFGTVNDLKSDAHLTTSPSSVSIQD